MKLGGAPERFYLFSEAELETRQKIEIIASKAARPSANHIMQTECAGETSKFPAS